MTLLSRLFCLANFLGANFLGASFYGAGHAPITCYQKLPCITYFGHAVVGAKTVFERICDRSGPITADV